MKTYGELHAEIDQYDMWFSEFCRGWDAAVEALRMSKEGRIDSSDYSEAQKAHLWGLYTGQIK